MLQKDGSGRRSDSEKVRASNREAQQEYGSSTVSLLPRRSDVRLVGVPLALTKRWSHSHVLLRLPVEIEPRVMLKRQ